MGSWGSFPAVTELSRIDGGNQTRAQANMDYSSLEEPTWVGDFEAGGVDMLVKLEACDVAASPGMNVMNTP